MKNRFIYCLTFFLFAQSTSYSQVILDEQFNNNDNHWQETETVEGSAKVNTQRRMYQVEHYSRVATETFTAWTEVDLNESKNFKITAQLYKEKGVKDFGYGLLWGGREDNYYSFLVSPGGFYCVGKVVDGIWNDMTPDDWIATKTVSCGNHAFNKLALSKIGDTYHFEINDIKVATMKCGAFFGNKIGINVNNKQKIMVDWIKVEYL